MDPTEPDPQRWCDLFIYPQLMSWVQVRKYFGRLDPDPGKVTTKKEN